MLKRITFLIFLSFYLFLCSPSLFAQPTVNYTPVQDVKIQDGQLWVYSDKGEYVPFFIKGVDYQPTPIGRHPRDRGYSSDDPRSIHNNIFDDPAILNRDFSKLRKMNANTIRIWKGDNTTDSSGHCPDKLTNAKTTINADKTQNTLDLAAKYGLRVIAGFWVNSLNFDKNGNIETNDSDRRPLGRQQIINNFIAYVKTFKDDRAILFWAIGNENNRNKINGEHLSPQQLRVWYALVNDMAQAAHNTEGPGFHPVAVVNLEVHTIGNFDDGSSDEQLPDLDIWGVNAYRGKSFYTLFTEYHEKSKKPLWFSELGIDAWHVNDVDNPDNGFEDQDAQSDWTVSLWDEIVKNMPIIIGGTVMEYSDEWWKSSEEDLANPYLKPNDRVKLMKKYGSVHKHLGYKDGGLPGRYASREWFGIMSISRNPDPKGPDLMSERKVYYNLQKEWKSNP